MAAIPLGGSSSDDHWKGIPPVQGGMVLVPRKGMRRFMGKITMEVVVEYLSIHWGDRMKVRN